MPLAYISIKNLFDQDFRTPRTCKEGCESQIFNFETKIGSTLNKICFDMPGHPWIKHACKAEQNLIDQAGGYHPLVFDQYVSCNLGERLLGFLVQIGTDNKVLIIVSKREDNGQFVRQLHQPFFYKEIDSRKWELNTYQEIWNRNGKLLYEPKKYICYVIRNPRAIKDQEKGFGDKNQLSIDFDFTS